VYCRHLIRSLLLAGDRSSAERQPRGTDTALRDELGLRPKRRPKRLLIHSDPTTAALVHAVPTTLYVKGAGEHLAYQTYGSGELDILIMPGFVSHVETRLGTSLVPGVSGVIDGAWATHHIRSSRYRAVGPGRISPERRSHGRGYRYRAAGGRTRVASSCSGRRNVGPACIKFAVDESRLVAGLILFGSLAKGCWAPDYPYALQASQYDAWRQQLVAEWGGPAGIETFARAFHAIPKRGPGGRAAARGLQSWWHLGRAQGGCATPT